MHAEYGAALDSSRTLSVCRLFLEAFVVLCICRRHIVPEISIYSVLTLTERVCFYKLVCKPSSFFPPVFEKHHVGRVPRREGVVMSLRINTTMTALPRSKENYECDKKNYTIVTMRWIDNIKLFSWVLNRREYL